jgi:hypothetical protein
LRAECLITRVIKAAETQGEKAMELTQKQIIGEYKKLKLKLGRSPKSKEFYHETSITPYHLENAFGSNPYTKLQQEVGD